MMFLENNAMAIESILAAAIGMPYEPLAGLRFRRAINKTSFMAWLYARLRALNVNMNHAPVSDGYSFPLLTFLLA